MFNTAFNELVVSVNDFILHERNRPNIVEINERISYYEGIVEEYYYLVNTLHSLQETIVDSLYNEVDVTIFNLEEAFTKYKSDLIVSDIVNTIEASPSRITFFDKITKFEKSLLTVPLIKIDETSIQDVLSVARSFAQKTPKLFFFENNPYNIDTTYNTIIPVKKTFDNEEVFLNGVYNYLFGIFNTYKYKNSTEIETMLATENILDNRLNEFQNYILSLSNNKLDTTYINSSTDYYQKVTEIMDSIDLYVEQIIGMHIYRYYDLNERLKGVLRQIDILKSYYFKNELYVVALDQIEYSKKLVELQDNIILIEKGVVTVDKSYVLSEDVSFKELIDIIILMSQNLKLDITYKQQYHISGQPSVCSFTFYQSTDFMNSIKTYYYQLMTTDAFDFNSILLEDFGDSTTVELRNIYTSGFAKYNDFLEQPIDYMVEFELKNFILEVEELQQQLKKEASIFFNNAFETSPLTFAPMIEKQYKELLNKLVEDIQRLQTVQNTKEFSSPLRNKALTILNKSIKYTDDLELILVEDKKYSMLGMSVFIHTHLLSFFNEYAQYIKSGFNQEDYARVVSIETEFYKTEAVNHNMFVTLSTLTDCVQEVFSHFNNAQNIFVNEQISKKAVERTDKSLQYINYLFNTNMFEANRQEMASNLDNFYTYVIDKRPNEKPFLINEKNLKLSYLDNTYIKINYIRLYDKITLINNEFQSELAIITNNDIIDNFNYITKLETLITYQNTILANLSRTLNEQDLDVNYSLDTILESAIESIHQFNATIENDITMYEAELIRFKTINTHKSLVKNQVEIKKEHKADWINILNHNVINPIKPISYNSMDIIKGTVPFAIELSADFDILVDGGETPSFTWEINGEILEGKEVAYTIYKEGITKVICSRIYPSGETTVRYVEFDIAGPTNSQVVKSNLVSYAPIEEYVDQPKITYFDSETKTQITIPISVDGNIADMIKDGNILVGEDDSDLAVEKSGLVILGFEGIEIAGQPFDYKSVFSEEFEMPDESDFLFDFQVSDPIANKSVIDITNSEFITYMAKVPSSKVKSVYDIEDVSEFQPHSDNTLPVIVGDIVIMKNKANRYAVISISSISSLTEVGEEEGLYNFKIDFDVYVNVSLNKFEQTQFKPLTTNYVVPTLVFETNSKELFSSLIERIEKINTLTKVMNDTIDNEQKIIMAEEIKTIRILNEKFYLFSEYNRLKAKTMILSEKENNINVVVDYDKVSTEDLQAINLTYETQLGMTTSFSGYMDDTTMYDFRNDIIDLDILKELYEEEQHMMKIILDTFDYMSYDLNHFLSSFKSAKYIDSTLSDETQYNGLSYLKQLPIIVANARTHLFRLKLLINMPILVAGKYIIPSTEFNRFAYDVDGNQISINDMDLYLLNKKIELNYGYETAKANISDNDLISTITTIVKNTQGIGLSEIDKTTLSTYIDEVERKCVIEYDDFFMLPFWMDYLQKIL